MQLLPTLALVTFALVICFALWSRFRTDKKLDKIRPEKSSLARSVPDPNFQPDPRITDPAGVSDKR